MRMHTSPFSFSFLCADFLGRNIMHIHYTDMVPLWPCPLVFVILSHSSLLYFVLTLYAISRQILRAPVSRKIQANDGQRFGDLDNLP